MRKPIRKSKLQPFWNNREGGFGLESLLRVSTTAERPHGKDYFSMACKTELESYQVSILDGSEVFLFQACDHQPAEGKRDSSRAESILLFISATPVCSLAKERREAVIRWQMFRF